MNPLSPLWARLTHSSRSLGSDNRFWCFGLETLRFFKVFWLQSEPFILDSKGFVMQRFKPNFGGGGNLVKILPLIHLLPSDFPRVDLLSGSGRLAILAVIFVTSLQGLLIGHTQNTHFSH